MRSSTGGPNTNSASRLNARCSSPACRNMYVRNVQGRASASSGVNPNTAWKRGCRNRGRWSREARRLATSSRRTHGVIPNIRCGPITRSSPTPAVLLPREPANPLAQLGEFDPGGLGGLREEAHPGHPRQRVGLQTKDVAVRAQSEVDAGVAAQLEGAMRRERELLELAGERRVELRREDLFRHAGRVLALVVEQLVLGNDLPDGERHVPEDADRELPAPGEMLHHHLLVITRRERHGRVEPLRVLDEREPDGGPLLRRLHDDRPPQGGG